MTRQIAFQFPPRPRDPGATFVPGEATRQARAALAAWRDWPGRALAIVGPPASGKSHLAQMWARDVGARVLPARECVQAAEAAAAGPVVVEDGDAVADDLVRIRLLDAVKEEGRGPLLLTARSAPSDWAVATPDLASRLRALAYLELSEPSDEELAGVIVKLFADRGLEPEAGVVDYLLRRMERSYAAAAELVAELDRLALERKRPVTRVLARELFAEEPED